MFLYGTFASPLLNSLKAAMITGGSRQTIGIASKPLCGHPVFLSGGDMQCENGSYAKN